jgi:hypothetical protein
MNPSSINPVILPQAKVSHSKHPYLADMAIFAALAAVLIGLIYWWTMNSAPSQVSTNAPVLEDTAQAHMLAQLKSSVSPSAQQVQGTLSLLKKSKPASTAQVQGSLTQLQTK